MASVKPKRPKVQTRAADETKRRVGIWTVERLANPEFYTANKKERVQDPLFHNLDSNRSLEAERQTKVDELLIIVINNTRFQGYTTHVIRKT